MQVVDQIPIEAVLSDDVNGACGDQKWLGDPVWKWRTDKPWMAMLALARDASQKQWAFINSVEPTPLHSRDLYSLAWLEVQSVGLESWVVFTTRGVLWKPSLPGQGAYLTWYRRPAGWQYLNAALGGSLSSVQTWELVFHWIWLWLLKKKKIAYQIWGAYFPEKAKNVAHPVLGYYFVDQESKGERERESALV